LAQDGARGRVTWTNQIYFEKNQMMELLADIFLLKSWEKEKNAEIYAIALLNAKVPNKYYMHSLGERWPVMLQKNPTCNFCLVYV
jgi:hypothetical protein